MRFAEFSTGMELWAGPRRVDEAEILEFARRYDPQWFHTDPARAEASRWKGLIASGWMTGGIAMTLMAEGPLAGSESFGSPGLDYLKWLAPVRPGDALRVRATVLETKVSSSGKVGVLHWRWQLFNQDDVEVLDLAASSLFELQPDG